MLGFSVLHEARTHCSYIKTLSTLDLDRKKEIFNTITLNSKKGICACATYRYTDTFVLGKGQCFSTQEAS